ncbi:AAA family ATPase, partial [Campylobacter coli]
MPLTTGLNFATKIIIIGLSLKKGDIFIIENPEIHLHPKAISKFADFFAFLVSKGIQVIIETHSNYLLSKLRYINFKKEF